MTPADAAWTKARRIADRDPERDRQDKYGMPMCRELLDCPGVGGWAVNRHGDAEAFRMSGPPATGDQPLSSVKTTYYLPSQIG